MMFASGLTPMILASPTVVHAFSYPVGPLEITGFGLAMFLAFVVAQHAAQVETARRGYEPQPVGDLVFAAVIGGLLGAKIYYAILTGDPHALLERAGFVFWGGLIGGTIGVLGMAKWKGLNLWRVSDVGGPAVMAAYAVGRTGCWAVGDDYGRPWDGALEQRVRVAGQDRVVDLRAQQPADHRREDEVPHRLRLVAAARGLHLRRMLRDDEGEEHRQPEAGDLERADRIAEGVHHCRRRDDHRSQHVSDHQAATSPGMGIDA